MLQSCRVDGKYVLAETPAFNISICLFAFPRLLPRLSAAALQQESLFWHFLSSPRVLAGAQGDWLQVCSIVRRAVAIREAIPEPLWRQRRRVLASSDLSEEEEEEEEERD